jgi:hypothetical protein
VNSGSGRALRSSLPLGVRGRYSQRHDRRRHHMPTRSGWNLLTATMPSTTDRAVTKSCATTDGASNCVGSHCFQSSHFLESLCYPDEDVQILRNSCGTRPNRCNRRIHALLPVRATRRSLWRISCCASGVDTALTSRCQRDVPLPKLSTQRKGQQLCCS